VRTLVARCPVPPVDPSRQLAGELAADRRPGGHRVPPPDRTRLGRPDPPAARPEGSRRRGVAVGAAAHRADGPGLGRGGSGPGRSARSAARAGRGAPAGNVPGYEPADLPEVGRWVPSDADGVPGWLRPFGGEVLVAAGRDGTHLAGVGIKRHDRYGHELAVLTEPAARGRDLARSLVAQAARQVLEAGAVPTYLHDPSNTPSARVAEAAGFVDGGCTAFGLREPRPPAPDREPRTR